MLQRYNFSTDSSYICTKKKNGNLFLLDDRFFVLFKNKMSIYVENDYLCIRKKTVILI